jgi:Asp-tRNA(Asn)/Glu-tRNA(Gln) amidotransferase B subunit
MKKLKLTTKEVKVGTRSIQASVTREQIQDLSSFSGISDTIDKEFKRQLEELERKRKQKERKVKIQDLFGDDINK